MSAIDISFLNNRRGLPHRSFASIAPEWLMSGDDPLEDYLPIGRTRRSRCRVRHGILEAGGQDPQQICTQCHALPDPHRHSAREWPAVVARIPRPMGIMRKSHPDGEMTKQITEFLVRHGRESD